MIPLAQRFAKGVADAIEAVALPWHVTRLGCRAEYLFRPNPPRNGGEAAAAADFDLERYMHLYALNRGVLLTPFHNMALMSPATTTPTSISTLASSNPPFASSPPRKYRILESPPRSFASLFHLRSPFLLGPTYNSALSQLQ
jgi:glutamate-1-semialdehyde aminotransferase